MRRQDFHYELPEELIAQTPAPERSASRLLSLDGHTGALADRRFSELPDLLQPGDLLVFNDTRVIKARLHGRKPTGGRVEVLVERLTAPAHALAQVAPARNQRAGGRILLGDGSELEILGRRPDGLFELRLSGGEGFEALLERCGEVPLPPYIERQAGEADLERYQTVYARTPGSVAAPTAGLHFDHALLARLRAAGHQFAWVTLHVGAGTFLPVRVDSLSEHRMHSEAIEVSGATCQAVAAARAEGRRVVAVGTTSVRALEGAAVNGGLRPQRTETALFITPGFRFQVVDALITNFHLPESTLLMLVSAFAGRERVLAAYRHAVEARYRFFSYGDAMLMSRNPAP